MTTSSINLKLSKTPSISTLYSTSTTNHDILQSTKAPTEVPKNERTVKNTEKVRRYRQRKKEQKTRIEHKYEKNELRIRYLEMLEESLTHELYTDSNRRKVSNGNMKKVGTELVGDRPEWFGKPF